VGAATSTDRPASSRDRLQLERIEVEVVVGEQVSPTSHRSGRCLPDAALRRRLDPPDDDRDLVEDTHRDRKGQHADQVVARRHRDDDRHGDDRGVVQPLGTHDPGDLQEDQQDRELEADASSIM
jgi:hypothetical protein